MNTTYNEFQQNIGRLNQLVQNIHRTSVKGNYLRSKFEREALTEFAFLKIFINWEFFLERSFLEYSLGNASCVGNIPNRRLVPDGEKHSYEIVRSRSNFVEWGNPDIIRTASKLFFTNGEPFETPIKSITGEIGEAKTVRNSIVHISSTTQIKLDNLYLSRVGSPAQRINPYDFLMSIINGATAYSYYVDKIEIAADLIANY